METLTLVFWHVRFLPIPLCHCLGIQKLWEAIVSSLAQATQQALGMQERTWYPKPDGQNGSHTCHPMGPAAHNTELPGGRGQFWMQSIVPHSWWHLAAPRISHSEEWNSFLFITGLSHPSRYDFSPHLRVMKICRYPFPLSGSGWTGTAAVTWEYWHGPTISGYSVLHLACICANSGKLRHLPA